MALSTSPLSDPAIKALRFSESRYRRLFETAQDGILLLNAETAQIEDVNPYQSVKGTFQLPSFITEKGAA